MTVAMTDHPVVGLGVQLGEISNGAGFDQAIDVFAFLQGHIPAGARRNFGQQYCRNRPVRRCGSGQNNPGAILHSFPTAC